MAHYDPPQGGQPGGGRPPGQPGGQPTTQQSPTDQPGAVQAPPSPAGQSVTTPTLRWVSIGHPQESIPLGGDDYVLDSVYNPSTDAWEVLVLVQPLEAEGEQEDEE